MQGPQSVLFFVNYISGPCIITEWLEMIHLKDLVKEGSKSQRFKNDPESGADSRVLKGSM